jgi:hypothetical protein
MTWLRHNVGPYIIVEFVYKPCLCNQNIHDDICATASEFCPFTRSADYIISHSNLVAITNSLRETLALMELDQYHYYIALRMLQRDCDNRIIKQCYAMANHDIESVEGPATLS